MRLERATVPVLFTLLSIATTATGLAENSGTIRKLPYGVEELTSPKVRDTYSGNYLDEIRFPLGGIGAGCICLNGKGALADWEIRNHPDAGFKPPYTFLGFWAKSEGEEPIFKVLEGPVTKNLMGKGEAFFDRGGYGFGPSYASVAGLPRMRTATFTGRFPFARVAMNDPKMPLTAVIEGWSPFIPGNAKDSSLPAALLYVTLKNPTNKRCQAAMAFSVDNFVGGRSALTVNGAGSRLIMGESNGQESIAIATPVLVDDWTPRWKRSYWHGAGGLTHFINTFVRKGKLDRFISPSDGQFSDSAAAGVTSLGFRMTLAPGEEKTIPLVIAWHFPKRPEKSGNYYCTLFENARQTADYVLENRARLEQETRLFQTTFFDSNLPGVVLESISSQLAVLRSTTVFRMDNGTLYGYEGVGQKAGCCPGTCSHVWHYVQSIAYLFPSLERQMRDWDYVYRFREKDGLMPMRVEPGGPPNPPHGRTAADGQFGTVLSVYRDWQISGDTAWLKSLWPKVKKSIHYAWAAWDRDKDGMMEHPRHNTLDLDLLGWETFCGSMYLAALRAGEEMATAVGDRQAAEEFRRVFQSGRRLTDKALFNGDYYIQREETGAPKQYRTGCISEQLLGQWWASMTGLGYLYEPAHVRKAIASVFRHNFREDCYDHVNSSCVFNINDDAGTCICTWPQGGRPAQDLFYADTFMVGYEDQVAANLIYEGFVLEGLAVIKAVRDRHDGKKRNPYSQLQCGNYYARSMANYCQLLALTGLRYSGVDKTLSLSPRICMDHLHTFFSVGTAWGTLDLKKTVDGYGLTVQVVRGNLEIGCIVLFNQLQESVDLDVTPKRPVSVSIKGR